MNQLRRDRSSLYETHAATTIAGCFLAVFLLPSLSAFPNGIVDDDGYSRSSFVSQLEDAYEVEEAESGDEALAKLAEADFDVVLSDIRMPGMSGIDLLEKITDRHPDVRVLVISALDQVDTAVEAMRKGA